jgi:hypothetical protein
MGARGVASAPLALGARPARFARRSRVEGSLRSGLRGARPGAFGPLLSNFGLCRAKFKTAKWLRAHGEVSLRSTSPLGPLGPPTPLNFLEIF